MRMPVEHVRCHPQHLRCSFSTNFGSQYGTLQWTKFAEIQLKGYEAALEMLAEWDQQHMLPSYSVAEGNTVAEKARKGRGQRRNSI